MFWLKLAEGCLESKGESTLFCVCPLLKTTEAPFPTGLA